MSAACHHCCVASAASQLHSFTFLPYCRPISPLQVYTRGGPRAELVRASVLLRSALPALRQPCSRFLQGPGTDKRAVREIRRAIDTGSECTVRLINYTKAGVAFWCASSANTQWLRLYPPAAPTRTRTAYFNPAFRNMFHLAPVRGLQGSVQYFIGVQVDVTARTEDADELARNSRLAGKAILGVSDSMQARVCSSPASFLCANAALSAQKPRNVWSLLRGSSVAAKPHRRNDLYWQAIDAVASAKRAPLDVTDFDVVNTVGRGDVGTVNVVRLKGTRALFAMKVLVKQEMLDRNKMHRVVTEDEILSSLDHPFVAALFSSFQTDSCLYFVMEYCPGGELYELLRRQPFSRFSEDAARFYSAEIVLAMQYLHLLGFVYRDLKPENVLLQASGHVVLTDFDLSYCGRCTPSIEHIRQGDPTLVCIVVTHCGLWLLTRFQIAEPFAFTNSFVGTEEYFSPEVLKQAPPAPFLY